MLQICPCIQLRVIILRTKKLLKLSSNLINLMDFIVFVFRILTSLHLMSKSGTCRLLAGQREIQHLHFCISLFKCSLLNTIMKIHSSFMELYSMLTGSKHFFNPEITAMVNWAYSLTHSLQALDNQLQSIE